MAGLKHVHRYEKATLGRNKWPIHRCDLPDCSHYISSELVSGKFSICHRCGERFVITKDLLKLAKPHCRKCIERKITSETKQIVDDILKDLLMEDAEGPGSSSVTSDTELMSEESNDFDATLSFMITK